MTTMSDEDPKAISEDIQHQLHCFTDRTKPTRIFAEYLHDKKKLGKIIYFYGDGGNGKSLLLLYLQKHFCQRYSPKWWDEHRGLKDEELQKSLLSPGEKESCWKIPCAFLDFDEKNASNLRPKEIFSGLAAMHRQLIKYNLSFPLYQYGCFTYLQGSGQLTATAIKDLFPEKELNLSVNIAKELLEVFAAIKTGGGSAILNSTLGALRKYGGRFRRFLSFFYAKLYGTRGQVICLGKVEML